MRIKIAATFVVTIALALTGQKAGACSGTHMSVTGSGSTDTNCLFNVGDSGYTLDVSIDSALTSAEGGSSTYEQGLVNSLLSDAQAGGTVNFNDGENDVTFTVPSGVNEITVTLTDANGQVISSSAEVLSGGTWTSQPTPAGCGGGTPPKPPLNTAIPGPGLNPPDNESAVNDIQGANLPLADEKGQGEGAMSGIIH
jgi:hypothetical protein